eukprot:jgi/Picsp_1/3661/NSC_06498-R1_uncharacterized wd repeat-containing
MTGDKRKRRKKSVNSARSKNAVACNTLIGSKEDLWPVKIPYFKTKSFTEETSLPFERPNPDRTEEVEHNWPADFVAEEQRGDAASRDRDIQGIDWGQDIQDGGTRHGFRRERDVAYRHYYNRPEDVARAWPAFRREAVQLYDMEENEWAYKFHHNWSNLQPHINHFQLRNLLWAPTNNDLFFPAIEGIHHWKRPVLDGYNGSKACMRLVTADGRPLCGMEKVPLVTTMCVKHGVLSIGGFDGELIVRDLETGRDQGIILSNSVNSITNAIDLFYKRDGGSRTIICSNNDCILRFVDAESLQVCERRMFDWPVNLAVAHPDGALVGVVGDHTETLLLDKRIDGIVASLSGHVDFSFACAWHPDGNVIATGNQDKTTRVYDLRKPDKTLALLLSRNAVRSLHFSDKVLAVAETADYVNIHATHDYAYRQQIDFFGEICGCDFSPNYKSLWIGIADPLHTSSCLEYRMTNVFPSFACNTSGA